MPLIDKLKNLDHAPRVILIGSGGLSIGQGGEFDYSGTQAIRALREEGFEVIVVNPNIATVQTDPIEGCKVYLYPIEASWIEKIIIAEKADAIIAGFGGQTALNCLFELDEKNILRKYGVISLGTSIETLRLTEDRKLFSEHTRRCKVSTLPSVAVQTEDEALRAADEIGFPVITRSAFALGGKGSGFAYNKTELKNLAEMALANSPQILIEKSLQGWKEIEYEVMRDEQGNAVAICNMENIDPLGVHTGDSIVVVPSQTLSDLEYQTLRDISLSVAHSLQIVGECNVQFALDPKSTEFYVIEVNARLSRSSALASKASGYPIAYIAAKLVLGYSLLEIKNPVTGVTSAFYEPALDYITVKIPRWDTFKFQGVSHDLGPAMKSVGEVMAIGENFSEGLQKAVRMVSENPYGLTARQNEAPGRPIRDLLQPTDQRIFMIMEAFRQNISIDEIHNLTSIDRWFLSQILNIVKTENEIIDYFKHSRLPFEYKNETPWRRWKKLGFGDEQIIALGFKSIGNPTNQKSVQQESLRFRKARIAANIKPVVKKIDTTAAEYSAPSNYLYLTYGGIFSDTLAQDDRPSAIILGSGCYRVGSSVEFDWCAVECSRSLKNAEWKSILINCNPETVSTDFNSSDHLYFDELTLERILDIVDIEKPNGVIVSMGGQLPNILSVPLARAGVKLLGHSPETIDLVEDRSQFSKFLDQVGVSQPKWIAATSESEVAGFVKSVGFPVIVRPSYVLSGAAMRVAFDNESLQNYLDQATVISPDHPVVISEFLKDAREAEVDGVASQGKVCIQINSEHIENAGTHSGDSTIVVPPQNLDPETIQEMMEITDTVAMKFQLNGPFNIQFLVAKGKVKVIECNARASRSFPFVSKVVGLNLAKIATKVIIGSAPQSPMNIPLKSLTGVKAAIFSFGRLSGSDPLLGVEMLSTGEVGCIANTFNEALLLSLQSAGINLPRKGVLISAGPPDLKSRILPIMPVLERLKIPLYATPGRARFLASHDYRTIKVEWPGKSEDDVVKAIRLGKIDFVVNIPKDFGEKEMGYSKIVRQTAAQFGCSLLVDLQKTLIFFESLELCNDLSESHIPLTLPGFEN